MNFTIMSVAMVVLSAGASEGAAPKFWTSLFGSQPEVESVAAASSYPGVDLANPLGRCERLAAIAMRPITAVTLKMNLGRGRRTSLDVWIAELAPGEQAHQRVLAVGQQRASEAHDDWQCGLSKRGLSLVQVGRYWIGLPTLCRRGHYRRAVSRVLATLKSAFPDEFPAQFIFGPCGKMRIEPQATAPFVDAPPEAAEPRR